MGSTKGERRNSASPAVSSPKENRLTTSRGKGKGLAGQKKRVRKAKIRCRALLIFHCRRWPGDDCRPDLPKFAPQEGGENFKILELAFVHHIRRNRVKHTREKRVEKFLGVHNKLMALLGIPQHIQFAGASVKGDKSASTRKCFENAVTVLQGSLW